jgi:hypothetical protein
VRALELEPDRMTAALAAPYSGDEPVMHGFGRCCQPETPRPGLCTAMVRSRRSPAYGAILRGEVCIPVTSWNGDWGCGGVGPAVRVPCPAGWRSPGAGRRRWPLCPARAAHLIALGWAGPVGAAAQQLWAGGVSCVWRLSIARAVLRAAAAASGLGGTDDGGRSEHVWSARR